MSAEVHLRKPTNYWLNEKDEIVFYRGNPLIGALGEIPSRIQIIKRLTHMPEYSNSLREVSSHLKPHLAFEMRRLFVPMPCHISVVEEVELLLRQGYRHRNPLDLDYRRRLKADLLLLEKFILPPKRYARFQLGTSATGTAGSGKTVSFQIANECHEVVHEHYYELRFERISFPQVPVITLHMFQDASLKAFGLEFFKRLEQIVQRSLCEIWPYESGNGNTIQFYIMQACLTYNVGMIVVDEMQNMKAHGKGFGVVLAYFTRLMNTVGVPVAVIGTELAAELIAADLPSGRRFLGNIPPFTPLQKGSKMWGAFFSRLWKLQYTKTPVAIDADKFSDLFHFHSAGIPDITVKLYLLVQLRLFGKAKEEITYDFVKATAALLLVSVKTNLDAVRKGYGQQLTETGLGDVEGSFREIANRESARVDSAPLYPEQNPPAISVEDPNPSTNEVAADSLASVATAAEAKRLLKAKGQLGL